MLALTPERIAESQILGASAILSHGTRALDTHNVQRNMSPGEAAWFSSSGGEGGAALLAPSTPATAFSAREFSAYLRARLGLHPHASSPTEGRCAACNMDLSADGLHPTRCKRAASLGPQTRHAAVNSALRSALTRIANSRPAGRAMAPCKGENGGSEPLMGDYFPRNKDYVPSKAEGSEERSRGDIVLKNTPRGVVVCDTVIYAASYPSGTAANATAPHIATGKAADTAYDFKLRHYRERFVIDGTSGCVFPIAMESGGRWAARSRAHLTSFIEWCIQTPRKDWSADDFSFYNRSIRDALDSTSLALARFTARQLLGAADSRRAAGGH